jgi:Na+-driven multidrug efflux pump
MDGVMTGATLNTIIRNGMVASLAIFLAAAALLQPVWGINGLWVALHLFLLARGVIFYFAVRGQMPRLFPQSDLGAARGPGLDIGARQISDRP